MTCTWAFAGQERRPGTANERRKLILLQGGTIIAKGRHTMAGEQGTGKHPHKSASDPKEHHEAATTNGESGTHKKESSSTSSEHSDGQGTGKHPHKSASDPKEHHEGASKR